METLTIQITDQNEYGLLNELEKLHLIKVLSKEHSLPQKLSDIFAGKLPIDDAKKLNDHIKESRDERDINR